MRSDSEGEGDGQRLKSKKPLGDDEDEEAGAEAGPSEARNDGEGAQGDGANVAEVLPDVSDDSDDGIRDNERG